MFSSISRCQNRRAHGTALTEQLRLCRGSAHDLSRKQLFDQPDQPVSVAHYQKPPLPETLSCKRLYSNALGMISVPALDVEDGQSRRECDHQDMGRLASASFPWISVRWAKS